MAKPRRRRRKLKRRSKTLNAYEKTCVACDLPYAVCVESYDVYEKICDACDDDRPLILYEASIPVLLILYQVI